MFSGRKLIIATKHEKEKVIAPVFQESLGVNCSVITNLDTDLLGTFSGEIERKDDPLTTARNKCLLSMELSNCDLAVASEGSFGPHPFLFFVPADEELLFFMDKKNNLEIVARELSTETNFDGREIKTEKELFEFAAKSLFPAHGLIIRKAKEDFSDIVKGIVEEEVLIKTFKFFISTYGTAFVETDMRAMYNPTRMKVIEKAAYKLVAKINTRCPECNTPGLGITDARQGLKCSLCGAPTNSTLSYIYNCQHCNFTKEEMYPNNKTTEDPMYCNYCNP